MSSLVLRASGARLPNPAIVARARKGHNLDWLVAAHATLPQGEGWAYLVLLGGSDRLSRRLRSAQARLRQDLEPSYWSHVILLNAPILAADTPITEISLQPPAGFGFPVGQNGVQRNVLGHYRQAKAWPNIALLAVPVRHSDLTAAITQLQHNRAVMDFPALMLSWLGYAWGVGAATNPLQNGEGLPSAVLLEAACSQVGFDLTPGLDSHAASPEGIWQGCKWWNAYHAEAFAARECVQGAFFAAEQL